MLVQVSGTEDGTASVRRVRESLSASIKPFNKDRITEHFRYEKLSDQPFPQTAKATINPCPQVPQL